MGCSFRETVRSGGDAEASSFGGDDSSEHEGATPDLERDLHRPPPTIAARVRHPFPAALPPRHGRMS